jgi:hypothetical protein
MAFHRRYAAHIQPQRQKPIVRSFLIGPKLISLPKVPDPRGNLSFAQVEDQLPFDVCRVYWIYDVPGGELRGSHAFRETEEIIIALSGSFEVVLHDGAQERSWSLNRSYVGLYVPRMIWRTLRNFSTNSVALNVASTYYNEDDYIRDFETFRRLVGRD